MHPSQEKTRLREYIKERLSLYPAHKRASESLSLSRRILEALPDPPVTICGYVPLKDEADIRMALSEIIKRGDHLYLPRFQNAILTFGIVTDVKHLKSGALHIPEPPLSAQAPDMEKLQIVLTPGRAFDKNGNRIGRGNGGYDVWIEKQRKINQDTKYWGIALECQVVEDIPVEPHDQKLDAIVTARGLIEVN